MFADLFIVTPEDIAEETEQRCHAIGMTEICCSYWSYSWNGSERVPKSFRIISARKTNQYEKSIYQDQFC